MTQSAAAEERAALRRFNTGLRLRAVELLVALPALALAEAMHHPTAAWFQGAIWILGPLSGLLLVSGANGFGARAAGLAFSMAVFAEGYASVMGFYGSPVAMDQVPVASAAAEILALIGLLSMVAALRGSAEDAKSPGLVRRTYRAGANVWVTLACVLLVRMVIWQVGLGGLPSLIVAGSVLAFAGVAVISVIGCVEAVRALGDPPPEDAQDDNDGSPGGRRVGDQRPG